MKGGQNSLLASGLYSDITFMVNSKSIAAHKVRTPAIKPSQPNTPTILNKYSRHFWEAEVNILGTCSVLD